MDDTVHAEKVITPVPVHAWHATHVPVAEERNVLPAIHVGRATVQIKLDPDVPDCVKPLAQPQIAFDDTVHGDMVTTPVPLQV